MDKKQKSELGVGTVFLVFGMYIFYEALKLKGKEALAHSGAFFPLIIASIIILLSIALTIKPISQTLSRAKKTPEGEEMTQSLWKVGIGLIILTAYPILVPRTGCRSAGLRGEPCEPAGRRGDRGQAYGIAPSEPGTETSSKVSSGRSSRKREGRVG